MIKRKGDVFSTDAFWIGHGCNVDGVMGAGVARTVRDNYPIVYEAYRKRCMSNDLVPGDAFSIYENGKIIVNLMTQDRPGPNARYDWIFKSTLRAAAKIMSPNSHWQSMPKVMALPMIGAGIGGLDWDKVETLLRAVEILTPGFEFEVWKYEG